MFGRSTPPLLEQKYDDAFVRVRDLEQIEQMAARFESRSQFLSDMTLDPPSSTQDFAGDPLLDEDYLTLSTIHSAKGLEWESVYVLHAADGNIPSDMATESRGARSRKSVGCSTWRSRARNPICTSCIHSGTTFIRRSRVTGIPIRSARDSFPMNCWNGLSKRRSRPLELPLHLIDGKAVATTADVRKRIGKMWS